jgi:hypothetical protein
VLAAGALVLAGPAATAFAAPPGGGPGNPGGPGAPGGSTGGNNNPVSALGSFVSGVQQQVGTFGTNVISQVGTVIGNAQQQVGTAGTHAITQIGQAGNGLLIGTGHMLGCFQHNTGSS